jgi:hypothetical protein
MTVVQHFVLFIYECKSKIFSSLEIQFSELKITLSNGCKYLCISSSFKNRIMDVYGLFQSVQQFPYYLIRT